MKGKSQEPRVRVKRNRSGPLWAGHPWLFSGAVLSHPHEMFIGHLVRVEDHQGAPVGWGHYGGKGPISVRMLALGESQPDEITLLKQRLDRAVQCRTRLGLPRKENTAFRLVSSEADLLPGLVVEQLGSGLVVGFNSAGMLRLRDDVIRTLRERIEPAWLVSMVTKDAARLEGLPVQTLIEHGDEETIIAQTVSENGVLFHIDPLGGQKTGYYADQRENHLRFCEFTHGKRVLDAYSYGGGFGLHALKNGHAEQVVCVDSSPRAGRLIQKNADLNGLRPEVVVADAIHYLKTEAPGRKFEVISIDPPKFVRSRSHLQAGMKKYRRVNQLAMSALEDGGILVSNSCSSMVREADFIRMLTEAGSSTGKVVQILHVGSQGPDHPFLAACPESRYLKCVFARVLTTQ